MTTPNVCISLAPPDANGIQACIAWQAETPVLPPLSQDQSNMLSAAIAVLFATVFVARVIAGYIDHASTTHD